MEFTSFPSDTLPFLKDIKANNNRKWFQENKPRYLAAIKVPAEGFCEAVEFRMKAVTDRIWSSKIFRIHRDIRFSKDKTPYNAHLHIMFSCEGRPTGLYFGLRPDKLFIGAGVFSFDKGQLEAFRKTVAGTVGAQLADIIEPLQGQGARLNDPPLKRVPKGFDADHPRAELLKRKGLALWVDLPDPNIMMRPEGVEVCFEQFDRLRPLTDWMNDNIRAAES